MKQRSSFLILYVLKLKYNMGGVLSQYVILIVDVEHKKDEYSIFVYI